MAGQVRKNRGNSGVNGLSQKSIKLFCDRKDSPKRSEFFGFYLYICHVIRRFCYTCLCSTKLGEKSDMAKS